MKLVRCLTAAFLIAGLAAIAMAAAEPQTAAPAPAPVTQSGPAAVAPLNIGDPTSGLAAIPENQAELEAVRTGELKLVRPDDAMPAPAIDAARQARRAAFDAVINEQNAKIEALTARLAGAAGTEALALQKQIEAEKKATSRRLLEVQMDQAAAAGDQAAVERVQAALTDLDAPAPAGQPIDRPVPVNPGR